tara:strand:- start:521 stop:754 length:234 start_codon:yes stop_codon:yes gene_type:complete
MINDILNKKIINNLYNERYNDIALRGKYNIVYCKKYYINFLKNVEIKYDLETYSYIKPIGVKFINKLINVFKNMFAI